MWMTHCKDYIVLLVRISSYITGGFGGPVRTVCILYYGEYSSVLSLVLGCGSYFIIWSLLLRDDISEI